MGHDQEYRPQALALFADSRAVDQRMQVRHQQAGHHDHHGNTCTQHRPLPEFGNKAVRGEVARGNQSTKKQQHPGQAESRGDT